MCPLKLGCFGVFEDSIAIVQIEGPWFSHCSYVLDLDLARSILPIRNFELVKGADRVRLISDLKIPGFEKSSSNLPGQGRLDVPGLLCQYRSHSSSFVVPILHVFLCLCTCTPPQGQHLE